MSEPYPFDAPKWNRAHVGECDHCGKTAQLWRVQKQFTFAACKPCVEKHGLQPQVPPEQEPPKKRGRPKQTTLMSSGAGLPASPEPKPKRKKVSKPRRPGIRMPRL